MLRSTLALCAAVLLCGCATTLERATDKTAKSNSLGSYSLPKPSLRVQIYYAQTTDTDGFMVAAETPRVVTGETIPLAGVFSPTSEDKFSVDVDPATGFLKEISINTTDRTSDTLVAAAASIGAVTALAPGLLTPKLAGAEAALDATPPPELVATAVFDPTIETEVKDANVQLWRQVGVFLAARKLADCKRDKALDASEAAMTSAADRKAAHAKRLVSLCTGDTPAITVLTALGADPAKAGGPEALATSAPFVSSGRFASANLDAPLCGGLTSGPGVCVRAAREVPIRLHAPGGAEVWNSARLPIVGEEYLLNVERAMFANKVYTVEFTDGFAGKREVQQSSQALTIAGVPKAMIDSFIDSLGKTTTALSNVIPIRVEYRSRLHPTASTTSTATSTQTNPATGTTNQVSTQTTTTTPAADTTAAPVNTAGAAPAKGAATATTTATTGAATTVSATTGAASTTGAANATGAPGAAPSPQAPPGPKLWFAACTYGLGCAGDLQAQLTSGDAGASAPLPPAGPAGGAVVPAPAPAPAPAPGATCTTPEQLKTPACQPK